MSITAEQLGAQIIREASRFVGLVETKPNADWDDPKTPGPDRDLVNELRGLMRPSPWKPGWAYCAAYAEGVILLAMRKLGLPTQRAAEMLQPGVMNTWRAFREAELTTLNNPEPGALWLAQYALKPGLGHAGIVTASNGHMQSTIEANTSLDSRDPRKDREGDWISTKLSLAKRRGSLNTLGYVNPKALLKLI